MHFQSQLTRALFQAIYGDVVHATSNAISIENLCRSVERCSVAPIHDALTDLLLEPYNKSPIVNAFWANTPHILDRFMAGLEASR